jgi:Tfp pilus assembly protein PilX
MSHDRRCEGGSLPARRGSVMFVTLATLAVVGMIAVAMVRGAMIARKSLRAEHALRQVETLLDAAEARVRARLAAGEPAAETLDLAAADVAGTSAAQVVVTAEPAGADAWRVRIVAATPPDGPAAIRRSRDTLIRSRSSNTSDTKETSP